jgi:hypothetical protein
VDGRNTLKKTLKGRLRRVIAKNFFRNFFDKRKKCSKRWKKILFSRKNRKKFFGCFLAFLQQVSINKSLKMVKKHLKKFFRFFLKNNILFHRFEHFLSLSKKIEKFFFAITRLNRPFKNENLPTKCWVSFDRELIGFT